jgi:hypothetical protein
MYTALLALLPAASAMTAAPVASLRVNGDQASFMVRVVTDAQAGYRVTIDCARHCRKPVHYAETTGDAPLGLFSRDQDNLLFSIWSAGSVYRVLVWSVSDGGVRRIAEIASRGRPDFLSDSDGSAVVRTYEGDGGASPLHAKDWTFSDGRFVPSKSARD